ncbi:MAG: HAD-IA family hydrolase [Acidimicrobiia bacterium]
MPARAGLLLDVGGVVVRHAFELREHIESRLGLPVGAIERGGPFGPAADPGWDRVERRELSEIHYWVEWTEEIGRLAGRSDLTVQELWPLAYAGAQEEFLRPEMVALVDEAAAAGVRTAMLSNDLTTFHGERWVDKVPFFGRIGTFFDAASLGARKPDPVAYTAAVVRLGLPPGEVLFVDDLPENVIGASSAGLPAVLFDITDPAGSTAVVRKELGL